MYNTTTCAIRQHLIPKLRPIPGFHVYITHSHADYPMIHATCKAQVKYKIKREDFTRTGVSIMQNVNTKQTSSWKTQHHAVAVCIYNY